TSLVISGTIAGDFAETQTACNSFSGGTLAASASCSITFVFTPSASAGTNEVATATLGYTGPGGSPATLALSGTSISGGVLTPNAPTAPATVTLPIAPLVSLPESAGTAYAPTLNTSGYTIVCFTGGSCAY